MEPAADLLPLDEIVTAQVPLSELEGGLARTQELIRVSGLDE